MQSNLLRLFFSSALCLGSVSAFAVGAPSEKAPFNKVEQANEKTVGGQVLDENGEPVIGATVTVKGTKTAVVTDIDGKFSFKVPAGSTLVVTYLGYADKEVAATGTGMTINMAQDEKTLDEVVVTALGIKRSEKALSYNVQQLGNEDLTTVKSTNFMNSLAGKVAGVNINASSAGMGGATRVVMRGPKSINQSNSALYVVDGVPINNRNNGTAEGIYASQPGGEGIADINPEDIESISVLSGPAAAAPYLTKIRNRAFSTTDRATEVTAYVAEASQSKEKMFQAIVDERALEFAGELIRKADLIRWGMLKSKMDETKDKMNAIVNLTDYDSKHPYSQLSGHVYYKMSAYTWTRNGIATTEPNAKLNFYGLNYGELNLDPEGYTEFTNSSGEASTWIKDTALDDVIDYLYVRDPDKYQYWPIFNVNLNDNPNLANYEWY